MPFNPPKVKTTFHINPSRPITTGKAGRSHPEAFCETCGATADKRTPYACKKHPKVKA